MVSWPGQQVQILDSATGHLDRQFPAPGGGHQVVWHPGGVLLAVGCGDQNVYLWDTEAGQQQAVLRGHQSGEIGVAFATGGDILVSWAYDGTNRLWDPWAGRELTRFAGLAVQVSRDGRRLAGWAGGRLSVWDVVPGRE